MSIGRSWLFGVVPGVFGIVLIVGAFLVPSFDRDDVGEYVCLVVPILLLLY